VGSRKNGSGSNLEEKTMKLSEKLDGQEPDKVTVRHALGVTL